MTSALLQLLSDRLQICDECSIRPALVVIICATAITDEPGNTAQIS
jgi:hypothetical protein